jgi:alkyl hydroperoxide reductase subunit AhpC
MTAKVGKEAPDFEIKAFFPDEGNIGNVRLSDYREGWLILCFYPGDFTYV